MDFWDVILWTLCTFTKNSLPEKCISSLNYMIFSNHLVRYIGKRLAEGWIYRKTSMNKKLVYNFNVDIKSILIKWLFTVYNQKTTCTDYACTLVPGIPRSRLDLPFSAFRQSICYTTYMYLFYCHYNKWVT